MKVQIKAGKYKPANMDIWVKAGEIVELPEDEARAAISANVAIEFGVSPVQPVISPIDESPRGAVRPAKKE
jgi:hypothetical protein